MGLPASIPGVVYLLNLSPFLVERLGVGVFRVLDWQCAKAVVLGSASISANTFPSAHSSMIP